MIDDGYRNNTQGDKKIMIFGKYTFQLKLKDDAILPLYKGSTFRGVLGHALKKTVCALKYQTCETCILRENCIYALVFETAHAVPQPKGARVSSPPHPLVLEPPITEKKKFSNGDILECSLLLFGKINQNLPYFIYAFDQMGKIGLGKRIKGQRARFSLESVIHEEKVIYKKINGSITTPSRLPILDLTPADHTSKDRLRIKIITPLRIMGKQNAQAVLPFPVLVRSLIRRTTSLLNTYGNGEPKLDYTHLAKTARDIRVTDNQLSWFDWQRYSARQDKKMFMGGLTGEIEYQGNLDPFMPFLEMVEWVHAGKNTAFGLGKIQIK